MHVADAFVDRRLVLVLKKLAHGLCVNKLPLEQSESGIHVELLRR